MISPGSLVCVPGRLTAGVSQSRPVRHEGRRVDIYVARLIPPWFNVSLPVHGPEGTLVASMWILSRRKLRESLQDAGFDVVEQVTWTDRGFRMTEIRSRDAQNRSGEV